MKVQNFKTIRKYAGRLRAGDILLRGGLAFVFLYAGIAIFTDPLSWIGYVPSFVDDISFGLSRETLLKVHGAFDIALGVWIISGVWRVSAGVVAGVSLALITIFSGVESLVVTFRDIGLALVAFAYAAYSSLNCGCKCDTRKK